MTMVGEAYTSLERLTEQSDEPRRQKRKIGQDEDGQ